MRFSIAHEIANTLFPDHIERVRNRRAAVVTRNDDWQLELLCNIAAAEFLMPGGDEIDSTTLVTIDSRLGVKVDSLRGQYDTHWLAVL